MRAEPCYDISFEAIPIPILIVNEDVQVLKCNKAASKFVADSKLSSVQKRAGDVLQCLNSFESAGGCGHSSVCGKCMLRSSVEECYKHEAVIHRRADLVLRRDLVFSKFNLMLTVSRLRNSNKEFAVLIIKDATHFFAEKEIIPICMHCRKLRDSDNQWHSHENYLDSFLNIKLTHCICESCLDVHYPELAQVKRPQ